MGGAGNPVNSGNALGDNATIDTVFRLGPAVPDPASAARQFHVSAVIAWKYKVCIGKCLFFSAQDGDI
jgi:hypothetical protein